MATNQLLPVRRLTRRLNSRKAFGGNIKHTNSAYNYIMFTLHFQPYKKWISCSSSVPAFTPDEVIDSFFVASSWQYLWEA
jgi:hypothetical protein